MKIRTIYFKTTDIKKSIKFWKDFLQMEPHKTFDDWHEFALPNINLGFVRLDTSESTGSNCVPVFEFGDDEVHEWIGRAKDLGATVLFDELENPEILSVIFKDPDGNEFEISKFH